MTNNYNSKIKIVTRHDNVIITSSCPSLKKEKILVYKSIDGFYQPKMGDVLIGSIEQINQHNELEDTNGRIHQITLGTKAFFTLGNRYATGYYEGLVPNELIREDKTVDLLARSGVIGNVVSKTGMTKTPTQIKLLGTLIDNWTGNERPYNTIQYPIINNKNEIKSNNKLKTILFIGSSMDSGKSTSASKTVWCLNQLGYRVSGIKVTGTASLKDILNMEDAGAIYVDDFTSLGYPSTYMLPEQDIINIFFQLVNESSKTNSDYCVIEIADGILQRETQYLLQNTQVMSGIDKIVYCCPDSLSGIAGLDILDKRFGIIPDAVSGIVTSYPLMIRELIDNYVSSNKNMIPTFSNRTVSPSELKKLLGL